MRGPRCRPPDRLTTGPVMRMCVEALRNSLLEVVEHAVDQKQATKRGFLNLRNIGPLERGDWLREPSNLDGWKQGLTDASGARGVAAPKSYQDPPDTVRSTRSWRRQVQRNAKFPLFRAAHSRRQSKHSMLGIDEALEMPVSVQRQTRFRRSWRFLNCGTLTRRSISLLRAQKTAWMPQVPSIEKRVDDTLIMGRVPTVQVQQ